MECKFCNAPLEEGMERCPECGRNQTEEVAAEEVCTCEETCQCEETCTCEEACECEETCEETPKKKMGLGAWVLTVLLAALIALGAVFSYNYFTKDTEEADPAADVSITGGGSYYAGEEGVTEEQRATVVASVSKNGLLRSLKQTFGLTGPGKEGLTNEMLAVYYWDGFYSFYNNYGYYASIMGLDPLAMDTVQYTEGQTWQEHFLSNALNNYWNFTAICAAAEAEGYELSPDMEADYATTRANLSAMEGIDELLVATYGEGVTLDEYLEYLRLQYISSGYMNDKVAAITVTDEEAITHYEANMDTYHENGIQRPAEGTVRESEAMAEDVYAQWQAGAATEDAFAQLANTYSMDPGSNEQGGLYENVYEGQMVPQFNDWCFDEARKPGDTGIVETSYGHHVMYFVSKNEDGTVNVRHILLESDDPNEWLTLVKEDLTSQKADAILADARKQYAVDYDLSRIVLPMPAEITGTDAVTE